MQQLVEEAVLFILGLHLPSSFLMKPVFFPVWESLGEGWAAVAFTFTICPAESIERDRTLRGEECCCAVRKDEG